MIIITITCSIESDVIKKTKNKTLLHEQFVRMFRVYQNANRVRCFKEQID